MRLYFPRTRGYLSDYCFTDLFKDIEAAISGEWCLDHIDEMSSITTVEVLNLPTNAECVWTITNGGTEGEAACPNGMRENASRLGYGRLGFLHFVHLEKNESRASNDCMERAGNKLRNSLFPAVI